MTRDELVIWARQHGWREDRWGHYQKSGGGKTYRLKISRVAARYELKTEYGWMRIASAYLRDVFISPDGKLSGLKREGC